MHTQSIPFGMYGLGQMGGWPQYPVPPQFLQGYQQDPSTIFARLAWAQNQAMNPWMNQNPWMQNQMHQTANPWAIQALLGELVGAIARQGHVGVGQGGFGPGAVGALPFASPLQQMFGGPFTGQGSYGNGIGGQMGLGQQTLGQPGAFGQPGFGPLAGFGQGGFGAGLPTMAMV